MIENIAIITGGNSSEREVSLQTSEAVSQSLKTLQISHEILTISDYRELLSLDLAKFTRVFWRFMAVSVKTGWHKHI